MEENSRQDPDQPTNPTSVCTAGWNLPFPFFIRRNPHCIFLLDQGNTQEFPYRCSRNITAPFILAYLAWIRPKKDIVALTTPLYSIILFVLPSDLIPDLILPILYAISLTILLVRLKYRFGKPGTAVSMGRELGGSLKTYIDQTREPLKNISPDTAHNATLAFVQFAQGDYAKVARISEVVTGNGDTRRVCISALPGHSASSKNMQPSLTRLFPTLLPIRCLIRNMQICWQNTCPLAMTMITNFTWHWTMPSSCSTALHGMDPNRTVPTSCHASHLRKNS